MSQWNLFPLWESRPNLKPFRKKQRDVLELTIAQQVADLLSRHGQFCETPVDLSASSDFDEPTTFQEIRLGEIPLEDGGDLIISQLPFAADGTWTNEGAHSVIKEDEDGFPVFSITVWDPSIEAAQRIHDAHGKTVGRLVLQELYEALSIVLVQADTQSPGNIPPLCTSDFPVPVIDSTFQALAMQYYEP